MASTVSNLNITELSETVAISLNAKFGKFDFATIANGDAKYWGDSQYVPLASAGAPVVSGARPVFQTDGSNTYSGKILTINKSANSTTAYYPDQRVNEDALVKTCVARIAKQVETDLFALATTANFATGPQTVSGGDWTSVSFKSKVNSIIGTNFLDRSRLWAVLESGSAATLADKHGAAYNYGNTDMVQGGAFARLFGANIYEADGTLPTTVSTTAKVGFVTDGTALGLIFGSEKGENLGSQIELSEGGIGDVKVYVRRHQDSTTGQIWLNVYSIYGVGVINPLGLGIITSAT